MLAAEHVVALAVEPVEADLLLARPAAVAAETKRERERSVETWLVRELSCVCVNDEKGAWQNGERV
jgi:hypothetical protein